jgi:hypothetical protein
MSRFLLSCVVVFVMLAVAPAANAQLTNLYNSMEGDQTVQGINSVPVGPSFLGTFRAATSFTPTRSGKATVLSMRGQCVVPYPQGTVCEGIGEVSIQADNNGRPSGVSLGTMGFYLTDSLTTGDVVKRECGRLSPGVQLTVGTKYWAVMTAPDQIGWNDWTDDKTEVLQSVDGGAWENAANNKKLALRVDAGVDECVPDAKLLPPPGSTLGDLYVRTGGVAVNSLTLGNQGLIPLTWSSYTVSGPDAQYFDVVPQAGAQFKFPRQIGVGGLALANVSCTGGPQERWYHATVTLHTNDPDTPDISFNTECLVDNTPPKIEWTAPQPDGRNGWFVHPIAINVSANDPEPSSLVRTTVCGSDAERWESPGAGLSVLMTAEGVHGIGCSASDRVGNTGSAGLGTFKLDTRPPVPDPVYTPERTEDGWNNTATSLSFDCQDPQPGSGVDQPATGGGSVSTETAGTDFTSGGCNDIAGNDSTPRTETIRIDMTKPVITPAGVTPAPNSAGWNRTDVTIAFDCGDTGPVQSGIKTDAVADQTVSAETAGRNVASDGDCLDKAANKADVATQHVKIDKTAPTTTIADGPAQFTNATAAELPFSGADSLSGVAGYECRLDNGPDVPCTSPFRTSALADGTHTLRVRTIDVAGNADDTPAAHTWTVDTVAPDTAVNAGPAAATSSATASFTYSGDPLSGTAINRYECRLDGGSWHACADYSGLADGEHRFEVRATDAAGNTDATPAVHTWTVDTAAPQTHIDAGPDAATPSRTASFTYSGDALGGTGIARYECQLDDAAWGVCAGSYSNLGDGEHRFQVRAIDAAGNADDTPATHAWTVDTAAPDTELTRAPDSATADRTAAFEYRGLALGGTDIARFECRLDGAAWGDCHDYAGLADGRHAFEVRAVDAAGNIDATPASHAWTVDTVAPQTTIGSGPDAVTASRMGSFTYSGDPLGGTAIAGYECRLDDGAWDACANYNDLAAGEHRFQVRAVDAAGNADDTPATHAWTIDLTAPTTTITAKPDVRTPENEARFTLAATDKGGSTVAGLECHIDAQAFAPCTSPVRYTGLSDGPHTFEVRASDAVGNLEDPAVAYTWTISGFIARDDAATTRAGTPTVIDVEANDLRPGPVMLAADPSSAKGGSVTVVAGGLRYVPAAGFTGTDTFRYQLTYNGDTSVATVTVSVTPVDDGKPDDGDTSTVTPGRANAAPQVTIARGGRCGRSQSGTFRLLIDDTDPARVKVTGSASSHGVGIHIGGTAAERTIAITRPPGLRRTTVMIRVTDGPHVIEIPIRLAVGTGGDDRIRGTAGPDLLFGLGGDDVIAGRGGDDLLCGGPGADRLAGGAGNDVMLGGRGDDVVRGGAGNDALRGDTGADRLIGGIGDDVLRGGPRADVFDAAPGADRLVDVDPESGDVVR